MAHEPDLNALAALADGRLTHAERGSLLVHVAECRDCRETLALLAEQHAAGPYASQRWRAPVWLPIAATLAIAATGLLLVLRPTNQVILAPSTVPTERAPDRGSERVVSPGTPDAQSPGAPAQTAPAGRPPGDLLRRRSAERRIGQKTFRLVAGEWIDTSYDSVAGLPVVEVSSQPDRSELLNRVPGLTPYTALGSRFTVVHDGTVYRFTVPGPTD